MRREKPQKQNHLRTRIAAAAARLMAEDGIDDFAQAKRKAARALGISDSQSLPGNDEVESELRTYLALYRPDEHAERLRELREVALEVMTELAQFRPYLYGPVLKGTAGRYADIDLQAFADDPKSVEIFLINRGIPYAAEEQRFFVGDEARPALGLTFEWADTPVRLAVLDARDERAPLKTTIGGRARERASLPAVTELVAVEPE
jgi:hypothetical protein